MSGGVVLVILAQKPQMTESGDRSTDFLSATKFMSEIDALYEKIRTIQVNAWSQVLAALMSARVAKQLSNSVQFATWNVLLQLVNQQRFAHNYFLTWVAVGQIAMSTKLVNFFRFLGLARLTRLAKVSAMWERMTSVVSFVVKHFVWFVLHLSLECWYMVTCRTAWVILLRRRKFGVPLDGDRVRWWWSLDDGYRSRMEQYVLNSSSDKASPAGTLLSADPRVLRILNEIVE